MQRLGDRGRAIEEWKTAVRLDAGNLDAIYNVGTALAASQNPADARPYLERFLQIAPPSRDADRRDVARLLAK
jgi:tetratricopeptide (TPR) repeat protein